MEGNFSRGHRPDGKRGRAYRRVLIQQGAALLDSDVAALVDANERQTREAIAHAACAAGSPDLGFLVTPGELLALFDPVHGNAFTATAPAEAVRDFSRRYLDRLPGLRIRGAGGEVRIPLRRPLAAATELRLWLGADAGATATVNGTAIAIPASAGFAAFPLTSSSPELVLAPDPAANYWLAMVETHAPAGPEAALHWAAGSFQIAGLIAETPGAPWPGLPDPASAALVAATSAPSGTRFAVYLELSERHVTGVEDPGIVEQALGGDHDTTTRTSVQAQVKLAQIAGTPGPDALAAAIAAASLPSGTVTLGTAAAAPAADPCDLPVPGGYTGPENRLYRLAVHAVAGGETIVKWSRENAFELFAAAFPETGPAGSLRVAAHQPLRDGDLVELLSEAIDLGDSAPGAVGPGGGFTRPERAHGRLLRLSGGQEITGATRAFSLRDPFTEAPIASIDPAPFGTAGVKIRRWSGLIRRPGTGPVTFELEHGIEAHIDGAFEPGDWWQFEARPATQNANGPAVTVPHGPERRFAPLALLEATAAGEAMRLLAWLDRRYRRLCETEADAVTYDGARAGTAADTVQEALDELYLRVSDGCGEIAVPLGASIQDVIDAIPAGGSARICLNAGPRAIAATINVQGKGDLILTGTGPGTLLNASGRRVIDFRDCRSVALRDFAINAAAGHGAILAFTDCGEVSIEDLRIEGRAAAQHGGAAIRSRATRQDATRRVTIRDTRLTLGHADTGILLVDPGVATLRDNLIDVRPDRFDLAAAMANDAFATEVGSVLLDRIDFHADNSRDFDFVGGPVLEFTPEGNPLTRRGIAMAARIWGRPILSFTTLHRLDEAIWTTLARNNQPPAGANTLSAGMRDFLRSFRRRLARRVFDRSSEQGLRIPSSVLPALNAIEAMLLTSNETIHGAAGIVVAQNRSAFRGPRNRDSMGRLMPQGQSQTVAISGNRIRGFRQGIRAGASFTPQNLHVLHSVDISDNHVELRLPLQAKQRHGIFLGHALAARITGNRIEDPAYDPTPLGRGDPVRAVIDCDGIRVWGAYGPLAQVVGNLCFGVTMGIRAVNLASATPNLGSVTIQNARTIADNAYIGDGLALLGSL